MEKLDLSYIGMRIKQARQDAKMTQEELGERIGKTSRYIQAIENENKGFSLDTLIRIVRALNLSTDAIIYPEPDIDSEADQWLRMFRLLSHRDQQILLAAAKAMLKESS
ncbi:MAG: helix-turn-helix domain-containing protein [Lachnospiraceae bacterium]|nr:helix-turn-helix domain-containing protein [Lachnospiraceae bacterium]